MFDREIDDEDRWLESMKLEFGDTSPEGKRREADRDRKFYQRLRSRMQTGVPLTRRDIRVRLPYWVK